ncbi:MAG: hypothetical protein WDW38_006046 [Sanguina aurantia]
MSMLLDATRSHFKFPVVFLTNGGGVTEAVKAAQLSEWLDAPVSEGQVILSHSPMSALASRFADVPVLVSGRGDVLHVARQYGFKHALHTRQLGASRPDATPFSSYDGTVAHASPQHSHTPSPPSSSTSSSPTHLVPASTHATPCPVKDLGYGSEANPIRAVLVMADPDDWYRDTQLILDVVMTSGVPDRREASAPHRPKPDGPEQAPSDESGFRSVYAAPANVKASGSESTEFKASGSGSTEFRAATPARVGSGGSGSEVPGTAAAAGGDGAPVEVFFSNPDLLWANSHPRSRLAQGAFAHMLGSLHERLTGRPLPSVHSFGKPNPEPYRLAERSIARQIQALGEAAALATPAAPAASGAAGPRVSAIYAVGDNPAADVRGANSAGHPWVSVLVQTGVHKGPGNCSTDPAKIVVQDVLAAVQSGLHRGRFDKWHSQR